MAKLKDGFYKLTASSIGSDLLVLLAGGGAKPISDFASAFNVKIWGLDFDGSSDIKGNLTLGYNKLYIGNGTDNFYIGWGNDNLYHYCNYYGHYFSTKSGEVMRINSSGNVGIGTTNPLRKLHVTGVIRADSQVEAPYFMAGIGVEGLYMSAGGIAWHDTAYSYKSSLINFTSDYISLQKNTSCAGTLDVIGTGTFNSQIISNVADGTAPLVITSTSRVDNLNADAVDGFHMRQWFTNASDINNTAIFWQASGNCSDVSSMGYAALINVIGDTGRRWQIWNSRNDHLLYWRPEKSDMSDWADVHVLLDSHNYKNYVDNLYWANLSVQQTASSTTHPTFGNASIKGGDDTGLNLYTSAAYTRIRFYNASSVNNATIHYFGTAYSGYDFVKDSLNLGCLGLVTLGGWNNPTLVVSSNTTTSNSDGKVGIGTPNPSYKLHVNGTISSPLFYYDLRSASTTPIIYIGANNVDATLLRVYSSDTSDPSNYAGRYGFSVKYLGTGSDDTNAFVLYADNKSSTTQNVAIGVDLRGYVGIGTTSPAYKLDVNGTAKATSLMSSNIRIECDNNGVLGSRGSEINNYNGPLYLNYHSGTHIIMATGGGNVGIGTGNPAYKLDVNGTAKANKVLIYDGTNAVLSLRTTTAGEYAYLAAYNTGGQYGADVVLHSGSAMVLGAGESAASMYDNNVDSLRGSENLYLTADLLVKIFTNCDSIGNRRHAATFTTDGYSFFHSYINIGGHEKNASSPSYVWGSNSTDNYLRSYQTSSLSVNYASSSGTCNGNAKGLYSSGYGNSNLTYYQTDGSFFGNSGWCHYIIANHGDGSNYYNFTFALPFWGSPKYKRLEGGTAKGWYTFITTENYTTELDGRYVNLAGDTMSGNLTVPSLFINTGDPTLKIYSGKVTDAQSDGNICLQTCIDGLDGQTHSYAPNYPGRENLVLLPRGGQVYIGTNPDGGNTSYKLYVAGNTYASGSLYAAHFYENSDILLKSNILEILRSDNIPTIKEFDWKEDGSHSYGLIAQELEEQGYSELVSVKDDGYKTVNYSAALSLIVGKLQVKIKELEKEIEILKNKN